MATIHTFKYTPGRIAESQAFPDGHDAKRPMLPVFLRNEGNRTAEILAVADTGADYCQFPAYLLEVLGLEYDFLPIGPCTGVGSDDDARFAYVTLEVPQIGEWVIHAGFSKICDSTTFLLGHQGFLERFLAAFYYHGEEFILQELPLE
jgi:hypothetical protein